MSRLTTVLFDLDGTIIDSVRLIIDSYHHTLQAHGIPPRTDDEWLAGIGTPLRVQFADWAEDPGLEAMIETYRDYNLSHHDTRVTAYPGVADVVRSIRTAGFRTGLVTSKKRSGAERGIRIAGLEGTMDVVVGEDDVENPKPHPEPLFKALDHLGVSAGEAIYIGDSVHDMYAGRAAGVLTAAALWGPFQRSQLEPAAPDYWLERPAQVLPLVRELGRIM